jgi:hypothetical protein
MDSGSVSGNVTTGSGGGVFLGDSIFNMTGGDITGNSVAGYGGGVYVYGSATLNMSGGAQVDTGNKVYLVPGQVITLSGVLSANPAANIETTAGAGTPVLGDDPGTAGSDITEDDNYKKFLVNGESDRINSSGLLQ